jgi:hypothetical protein
MKASNSCNRRALVVGFAVVAGLALPREGRAAGESCKTRYPIVLSHHFGVRKICDIPRMTPELCEQVEEAKNCRNWVNGHCTDWRVPETELDLPPRNVNLHVAPGTPALARDMAGFHRYYSKDIVTRLRTGCMNAVYLSDKPAFASYEMRARSLRNTVLQALRETQAAKVNIIGMSQGSQDARWLVAKLAVDDHDPSKGWMRDKVASISTVVGEDGGTGAASLFLDAVYVLNHPAGGPARPWSDPTALEQSNPPLWTEQAISDTLWRIAGSNPPIYVLTEGYTPGQYNLTKSQKYATYLHPYVDLSMKYMAATDLQGATFQQSWNELCTFVGKAPNDRFWSNVVTRADEVNNGVKYFSYAAKIRNWDEARWGSGAEYLAFLTMWATLGDNDGYVTVAAQSFTSKEYNGLGLPLGCYPNFHHVKTMAGSVFGRGYHHMFFGGRNDELYQPAAGLREPSPYGGSSADFYEAVAAQLKAANL